MATLDISRLPYITSPTKIKFEANPKSTYESKMKQKYSLKTQLLELDLGFPSS